MAVCSKCAATVPDEAKFCSTCGQPMNTVDVQPVIQEQQPPQYQAEPVVQADAILPQESPLPQEEPIPQQSYYAAPQNPAPQQSYYAQPGSPNTQQNYYAQGSSPAQPQSYYAQPQNPTPQQSYYAQPGSPAQPQNPAPQQSYYTQPQNQPPQQSYYAPQQNQANPQQNYYAQQQNPNQQQNYYAQQQNNYGYQQPGPNYQTGPQDIEENKGICVLCYLGILLLIPLLSKPNSAYVKYHSNQGLVLLILSIAIGILTMIPYLGWFIIAPVGYIFTLVCVIMGIVNTVSGQMKPLPLIGKISLIK